ncbi:uncharacterized protein LOC127736713 isoform X2 [Mytilus californianus]|uniref:uncharacterized protein LOC127736713 isoform X2 n=1 Tax=Mytilus californianus TaxID=6549 RepID=UPI00224513BE|nr:uncharacterized protein LOC127736713 isoform X2 [Mytilus californianus]
MTDTGEYDEDDNNEVPVKIHKGSLESTTHDERVQGSSGFRSPHSSRTNGNEYQPSTSQYPSTCVRPLAPTLNNIRNHETHRGERKDIMQKKEECRTCRRKIIRNWKVLKKYVFPAALLAKLDERNLLSRENFEDLDKMNRSLAQDKVLTASYRNIRTQNKFDIFRSAVNEVSPGANIEWDANNDSRVPYDNIKIPQYVSSDNLIRQKLGRIIKGKVAINIKDDFLVHSIITIDEHEIISKDIRDHQLIEMILKKVEARSLDCLVYSLQHFNETQKQSSIETLVDMLYRTSKPSDLPSTKSSIEMQECSFNPTLDSSADFQVKLNLTNDNQHKQPTFNDAVVQNVDNLTPDLMRVLGSYPAGAEKGSVIIFLKSLEKDLAKRLQGSLIDDSFCGLIDKLFNDKSIKTSLSKGEYKLEVTIEPYEGVVSQGLNESECLTENEKRSPSNLISVNRSFLIDQINVIALLQAFGSTNTETIAKFEKAGIYKATEITKQSEIFLDVVEKEGLQEAFCNILQEKEMTYVLNRLQTYQKVCSADYTNLRRNIIHKFEKLVNNLDIDDMRETFVERKVFDNATFDILEEQFEDNREQATAAVLIEILKAGHEAVVTLVDVLYMNAIDSLANDLLAPLPAKTDDEEYEEEIDDCAMEKKEVGEETCSKCLKYKEFYANELLERDKANLKNYDKILVQQEYKQFLMDTMNKDIKISEERFCPIIQKERENFYRHSTAVLDLGKEALAMLLKHELSKNGVKFVDFLAENRHNFYHCVYTSCCRCQFYIPEKLKGFPLSVEHLEIILNSKGTKLNEHRHGNFSQLCCSPVNHDLTIGQLDFVLLKLLLASLQLQSYVQQAVDKIETCRNESFYKADIARLKYVKYLEFKTEFQDAILTVCRYCNTEKEMVGKMKAIMLRPLDMTSLYKRQQKILDAVEEITDEKIRNRVEDKVGVVEFQSSLSEVECKQLCGKFYKQAKDELTYIQAESEKIKPQAAWWDKLIFHHKYMKVYK